MTDWISELKKQNSFSSALDFFVKTAGVPVLYFEYQEFEGCLLLKQSSLKSPTDPACRIRLYESDPDFEQAQLYSPKKIKAFHIEARKRLAGDYRCFLLVFEGKVKGICALLSDSSLLRDRFFILNSYVKDFLWKEKWDKSALVDDLTFGLNQKAFLKKLFVEFSRARRLRLPLSLILLQPDQTQDLERSYGSYKTNIFIKSLANHLIKDSRAYDVFGSWPPGFMGMILPHTSERGAGMKAEKIRWSVNSADFSKVFSSHGRLSLSLGLAEYPRVGRSADSLFQSTLKALAFAREKCGGNMTAVATPAVGFKPDFLVSDSLNNLRDLT